MRPRVSVKKHFFQSSLFSIASGAITPFEFAKTVVAPAAADNEIQEGAIISAIYIEYWLSSDDAASGSAIVTLEKRIGSSTAMTAAESAALIAYDNKKNVLHTFMGLMPSNVQYPMAAIKGWFKIPKGKQRFGLGDKLVLNIHGQSNGLAGCGFAIYKEQT